MRVHNRKAEKMAHDWRVVKADFVCLVAFQTPFSALKVFIPNFFPLSKRCAREILEEKLRNYRLGSGELQKSLLLHHWRCCSVSATHLWLRTKQNNTCLLNRKSFQSRMKWIHMKLVDLKAVSTSSLSISLQCRSAWVDLVSTNI